MKITPKRIIVRRMAMDSPLRRWRRSQGMKQAELAQRCGVTLNPATPFEMLEPHLGSIDLLLIMTVHPGFGGQTFRMDQMPKVEEAKRWRAEHGADFNIEVDGGINPETAAVSIDHGANVLVAGTSIFRAGDYAKAITGLRGAPP